MSNSSYPNPIFFFFSSFLIRLLPVRLVLLLLLLEFKAFISWRG